MIRFDLHPGVIDCPEARHALTCLAALLEVRSEIRPAGAPGPEASVRVWVGPPEAAPGDADLVIAWEGWPPWSAEQLVTRTWGDVLVLAPSEVAAPAPGDRVLPTAWLRTAGYLLSREEEFEVTRRDTWDCFPATASLMSRLGVLERPLVNELALDLERHARVVAHRRDRGLVPFPRWPDGRRFAAVLSHDVDWLRRYSYREGWRLLSRATSGKSYPLRHGLRTLFEAAARGRSDRDPYWNFDRWVELEREHGARSTFFVCVAPSSGAHPFDPAYRLDDPVRFQDTIMSAATMFQKLAEDGFEIGLHGSYMSHVDPDLLARQRRALEHAIGRAVSSIRQHFLRFDINRTWKSQREAGFTADATLGYNEGVGFRAGVAAPFPVPHEHVVGGDTLLEIPTTLMDGVLFRTLAAGREEAIRATVRHLEVVERIGGLAGLLWHPNAADPIAFPGWWDCYEAALAHLAGRGAWMTTVGEAAGWWRERMLQLQMRAGTS